MHWLKTTAIIGCMAVLAPAVGAPRHAAPAAHANPFAVPSTLPFQAPPFDRIKDADYQPAFEQGMAEQVGRDRAHRRQSGRADLRQHDRGDGAVGADARPRQPRLLRRGPGQHQPGARQGAGGRGAQARPASGRDLPQPEAVRARADALRASATGSGSTPSRSQLLEIYLPAVHPCRRPAFATPTRRSCARSTRRSRRSRPPSSRSCSPPPRRARWSSTTGEARRPGRRRRSPRPAQAAKDRRLDGKWVLPLQNTTQQPALQSLSRPRDPRGPVRAELDPRREGRRQRHARDDRAARPAARAEGGAARLPDLGRLCPRRPDGEDARGGAALLRPARPRHRRRGDGARRPTSRRRSAPAARISR